MRIWLTAPRCIPNRPPPIPLLPDIVLSVHPTPPPFRDTLSRAGHYCCLRFKAEDGLAERVGENIEVIGKRPRCTDSRLVVYNQRTTGMSGRRTMAV